MERKQCITKTTHFRIVIEKWFRVDDMRISVATELEDERLTESGSTRVTV